MKHVHCALPSDNAAKAFGADSVHATSHHGRRPTVSRVRGVPQTGWFVAHARYQTRPLARALLLFVAPVTYLRPSSVLVAPRVRRADNRPRKIRGAAKNVVKHCSLAPKIWE